MKTLGRTRIIAFGLTLTCLWGCSAWVGSTPIPVIPHAPGQTIETGVLYSELDKNPDWSSGYTTAYVGVKRAVKMDGTPYQPQEFLRDLLHHVDAGAVLFKSYGVSAYIFYAAEDAEFAIIHWSSPAEMNRVFQSERGKAMIADAGRIFEPAPTVFEEMKDFGGALTQDRLLGYLGRVKKGKVLVILSGENHIMVRKNKDTDAATISHDTGFFLSELMVPVKKLVDAGYTPVFATPQGTKPVMDKISDDAAWFVSAPNATSEQMSAAKKEYGDLRQLCQGLGACGEGRVGTKGTKSFYEVLREPLDQYSGIFVPGGHAPMEDLWKNPGLGAILRHFHVAQKPTALICHGPIALLSTLENPTGYIWNLTHKGPAAGAAQAQRWIYSGYSLTVFTTAEEQQEEPEQANVLEGFVRFYPDQALDGAGAKVDRAPKWTANVKQDRELITGQNPMSDQTLGDALVKALDARAGGK